MRSLIGMILSLFVAASSFAEPGLSPTGTEAAGNPMARFEPMHGDWKGTAVLHRGPGNSVKADMTEAARAKLDGRLLVVEGRGVDASAGGAGRVVHDAFGIIAYDSAAGRYTMHAYRADGSRVEAEVEPTDEGMIWSFSDPRAGRVRFTTRVADGKWNEVGETSRDGTTWTKFFEMNLTRQ